MNSTAAAMRAQAAAGRRAPPAASARAPRRPRPAGRRRRRACACAAAGAGAGATSLSAQQLRALVEGKWGRAHEVRIDRVRTGIPLVNAKTFFALEVGWKYLGQLGQDELTEEEYEKQLKDVCMVLKAFEVSAEDVTALVDAEKKKPGTGAGGDNRGFDCVRIKLDVSAEGF